MTGSWRRIFFGMKRPAHAPGPRVRQTIGLVSSVYATGRALVPAPLAGVAGSLEHRVTELSLPVINVVQDQSERVRTLSQISGILCFICCEETASNVNDQAISNDQSSQDMSTFNCVYSDGMHPGSDCCSALTITIQSLLSPCRQPCSLMQVKVYSVFGYDIENQPSPDKVMQRVCKASRGGPSKCLVPAGRC